MSTSTDPRRRRTTPENERRRTTSAGSTSKKRPSGSGQTRRRPPQNSSARRGASSSQTRRPPQNQNKRRGRKKRVSPLRILGQTVGAVVAALVIALILRSFLIDVVRVNGHSMDGTVGMGDTAIMTKFDYWVGGPARGDVVCFELPGGGRSIKRVVGLPGEMVEIVQGITYINGEALDESKYVTMPDSDTYVPVSVPIGYYLVLSDNRPEGGDSRSIEVGLVSDSQLLGKIRFVIMPLNRMGGVA